MANPKRRVGSDLPVLGPAGENAADFVDVEVIYAEPRSHLLVQLRLPAGSTLRQAIEASGVTRKFPEMDLVKFKLGIYGKIASADVVLSAQDRIEIYRPLLADPTEARQQRAAAATRPGTKRKR